MSGKTYVFEKNEQEIEAISFGFGPDGCLVTLRDDRGEHRVACGSAAWQKGTTTFGPIGPRPVAARGTWTAGDTYALRLCYYETPFCPTITCRFAGDTLTCDYRENVSFGPTEHPQLVGRLA